MLLQSKVLDRAFFKNHCSVNMSTLNTINWCKIFLNENSILKNMASKREGINSSHCTWDQGRGMELQAGMQDSEQTFSYQQ